MRLLPLFVLLITAACGSGPDASDTTAATAEVVTDGSGFTGIQVPGTPPAPALRLRNAQGEPFDLAAEQGKVVLVFFGYTNCPDICPTTLATWSRAKKQLGADTASVRWVFVTVDPDRDTPEVVQRYARQFDPSFVGLSGSAAQLDSAQQGFRVSAFREPSPAHGGADTTHGQHGSYTMAHASRVFAIDRQGRWRLVLPASASVDQLLADVRKLLREG